MDQFLFNSYSSTIHEVIDTEIAINTFANDHSLQRTFNLEEGMKAKW